MYSLETARYSDEEIRKMLTNDRKVWYDFVLLDKDDIPLGKITATGSIDLNSTTAIQRCASLQIVEEREIDFLSERIAPYMCLETPSGVERFPLGVFLMSSPSRKASTGTITRGIECYDKCQILSDDKFDARHYIASGTNYISAVSSILTSAGITNARLTATEKETAADLEFEIGTSKLTAINKLLAAINYENIYCDSHGFFVAKPYSDSVLRSVEARYVTNKESIVFSGAEEELDTFNAPNKIVRYLNTADRATMISTVTNNDPLSKLSTVSRGRTIVDIAPVEDIADQLTLDAYTQREAAMKKIYQRVIFETAAMPNHETLDCLYLINSELDIQDKFIEESWSIDLSLGGRMRHICKKAVSL